MQIAGYAADMIGKTVTISDHDHSPPEWVVRGRLVEIGHRMDPNYPSYDPPKVLTKVVLQVGPDYTPQEFVLPSDFQA